MGREYSSILACLRKDDFDTGLMFINYTILPLGTSTGSHTHGNNEEMYIILEGFGMLGVNSEMRNVSAGDIILNKPYGIHRLMNNHESDLKILVFDVSI